MTATRLTAGPPNPAGRALETIGAAIEAGKVDGSKVFTNRFLDEP